MPAEPPVKRAVTFVDAQNLFHAAAGTFGRRFPDFDALKLSLALCHQQGWTLDESRVYTGVPSMADNPFWNHFWTAKLAQLGREGVFTYSRALRYRRQTVTLPTGTKHTIRVGQEKGIDIRLALDVIRLAHKAAFDVALIMSQDQDLSEVADELRVIAKEQARWIKVASAFPSSSSGRNTRGINGTDWIRIDWDLYRSCIDPRDYRPKTRT